MEPKIGDVVQLNSGGRLMTIVGFELRGGKPYAARCAWHSEDGCPFDYEYPIETIRLAGVHGLTAG